MSKSPFFFAFLLLVSSPAQADFSDWYGTIRFSKTFSQNSSTTFPPGHAYHPGTEIETKATTWSGTVRYLPGKKSVVSGRYHSKRVVTRRTDHSGPCPWKDGVFANHDYEDTLVETTVPVNKEWPNSKLNFRIREDGTYRTRTIASGGNHIDGATRFYERREWYNECSLPHLTVNEQETFGSNGMESLDFEHIEGTAEVNAQQLSGSWSGVDPDDGGQLTYSWELTRAEPLLVARIQGTPVPVLRAGEVTLSGAASTGTITKYEWEFTPNGEDCLFTAEGVAVKLEGRSVTFMALCDFTARLQVSNDTNSDSTELPVTVQERRGEAWKTTFQTRVGPTFTARIFADEIHFGMNRCAQHSSENASDHMIHTDALNNRTWREGGYTIAQVRDSGPFQGAWYVESQQLKIDRLERVNASLLSGSEVYTLNKTKNNQRDMDALIAQVRAHEAAHSSLLDDRLKMLGHEGDPAVRIEKLVGAVGEEPFQFLVDFNVRDVETVLQDATAEDHVKDRLRSSGFARDVSIWFPTRPEFSGGPSGEFLKALGPLWGIGH